MNRLSKKEKEEIRLFKKECRKTDYEFKKKSEEERLERILQSARGFKKKEEDDLEEEIYFLTK